MKLNHDGKPEYCEDWHLIEIVTAVRSKVRRPIGEAVLFTKLYS